MHRMVEEMTCGRHTIEPAMSKYQMLTRSTVTNCLKRVRQKEQARAQAMEDNLR